MYTLATTEGQTLHFSSMENLTRYVNAQKNKAKWGKNNVDDMSTEHKLFSLAKKANAYAQELRLKAYCYRSQPNEQLVTEFIELFEKGLEKFIDDEEFMKDSVKTADFISALRDDTEEVPF